MSLVGRAVDGTGPAPRVTNDAARVRAGAERVAGTLDIAVLYRRYGDMVLGRCRSLLGNDADAQEAMQEVFLQVHRQRDAFRGEASPTTYLYRAATNTCLNRMRTRRRRPEEMVAEPPAVLASDALVDQVELRQVVQRLLADEDERTVSCVVYHYLDGMTHDEAGALLGISGAAVRKRIGKFRERLGPTGPSWFREGGT
jgi:RNA polymerase sigma-70 factor (ECF subfamily)